jgi:pilus assembly protein CpaB
MRPVAIVLVVAVFAAGLTAFLAKRWLDEQSARQAAGDLQQMAEVLVAGRDVDAGTVLQAGDLRYDAWPQSALNPRLLVRKPGEDPRSQFIGQVTRRTVAAGEPFTAAATFRQDSVGVLAGTLAPGMRAVSIAITNASAVAGFVTPGDHVDVVLAADVRKNDSRGEPAASGTIVRFSAETVLSDVKVLAVDQQMARGRDGAPIQAKTATIEVTPKQGETVIAAGMLGNLSLVLRGLPDAASATAKANGPVGEPPAADPGYTSDLQVSKALQAVAKPPTPAPAARHGGGGSSSVQVNRGGHVSTQSLSR